MFHENSRENILSQNLTFVGMIYTVTLKGQKKDSKIIFWYKINFQGTKSLIAFFLHFGWCCPHPSLPKQDQRSQKLTPRETKIKPKIIRKVLNLSRKVSKNFQKYTYKKFTIILKWCTNPQETSPKIVGKISHHELQISIYLSNISSVS